MGRKFLFIWETAGSTFLFKYLKEVLRLTVRRMAEIDLHPSKKIFVKLNRMNFPAIIPLDICSIILGNKGPIKRWSCIVAVLTIISLFRVLPTVVKPDYSSITDPFNGISDSIDSSLLTESLSRLKWKSSGGILDFTLKGSLKAGPNGKVSLLTFANDATAFIHDPLSIIHFIFYNLKYFGLLWGSFWSIWLLVCLVVLCPIYIISLLVGARRTVMGKLSVVYDQAGKARIVGITNSWIQVSLYSFHNKLFSLLRGNKQDGTFDQKAPFDLLLKSLGYRYKLFGYDLTAATDRLPITLQRDIISLMGFGGHEWQKLLSIRYYSEGKFIKYAVGQPMGAYSSFAMLAITHHVIVQCAAITAGQKDLFTKYCILGDDIVIANEAVALEYVNLMKNLGLEIQESKSVNSSIFTEFAKKLRGPSLDLSPIGAGLILYCLRNRFYVCVLIFEMLNRGLATYRNVFPKYFDTLPKKYLRYRSLVTWFVSLHLRQNTRFGDHIYVNPKLRYLEVINSDDIKTSLLSMILTNIRRDIDKLWRQIKFTLNKGLFVSQSRTGLPDFLELFSLIIIPSTYIIFISWAYSINDISKIFGKWWIFSTGEKKSHNILDIIGQLEQVSMTDLDFNDKARVKITLDNLYKLNKVVNVNIAEIFEMWNPL